MGSAPILLWLRRDFRLTDHPALHAAVQTGRPVIPVFILDPVAERLGAAAKWRLERALEAYAQALDGIGSRLILRRGDALETLRALVAETGASSVHWTRAYDPDSIARDRDVKSSLKADGLTVQSHHGHLLFEPWSVETGQGTPYRVYSPFWKAVRHRDPGPMLPAPERLATPEDWPASDRLADWRLGAAMNRGAEVLAKYTDAGERAALDRLDWFAAGPIDAYRDRRDMVAEDACSGLSQYLTLGEIGPRQCWHAGWRAVEEGKRGASISSRNWSGASLPIT